MEQLAAWLDLIRDHPGMGIGAVVAILACYYLLQRKPRIAREADRQVEVLRKKRAGHYDKVRPPH